ncbi:TPA: GDP-mannose 4,6-dehydratase [Serratia fonticola]
MIIIITSGASFVRSAVARHRINETSSQTLVLDSRTYMCSLGPLAVVPPREHCKFQHADICNLPESGKVFTEFLPRKIMQLATEIQVERLIDGPVTFIETNDVDTYSQLEAARQCWRNLDDKVEKALGSAPILTQKEVHGDLHGTDDLFTEIRPYAPSSPYSASKATGVLKVLK